MPHDRAPGLEDERPVMARRMRATLFAAVVSLGMTAANSAELPLLPMPANVTAATGAFTLAHAHIQASGVSERAAAERLRTLLTRSGGSPLGHERGRQIRFHRESPNLPAEGYRVVVDQSGGD